MRRAIQFVCGLGVCAAFFYSWLWTLSFVNRVNLYLDRDKYRPATFVVTGAEFHRHDDGFNSWWLQGTVSDREERFVPASRGLSRPASADEVLARYPKGSEVSVFYNLEATETIIQGETLRVVEATPDFWEREAEARRRLGLRVLVPVPVALSLYVAVRLANRRRAHPAAMDTPPDTTCI